MNFQKLILEAEIGDIKRDVEDYLEEYTDGVYKFPYQSNTFVKLTKSKVGAYGYVLILNIFKKDEKIGRVIIRKGKDVIIQDESRNTLNRFDGFSNMAGLFGKILEVIN